MNNSDVTVAVTSPSFDDYFREELGLDVADSAYLPQFAESMFAEGALAEGGAADTAKSAEAPATRCAVERFDASKVNLTFAGNVGRAQSVETIVDAAALLRDDPDIVFHVVGSGSALDACRRRAKELGLGNVVFHGRKPIEVMPAYYAASDAMVVTLAADPLVSRTLPRKVQSYLAAGKPVLAAADGETARVLGAARCGLRCGSQDARGFAEICRRFAALPRETRLEMGAAARMYYSENFTKERFVDDLERLLRETAGMEVAGEIGAAEKAGVAAVPEPVDAASASVEGAAGVAA